MNQRLLPRVLFLAGLLASTASWAKETSKDFTVRVVPSKHKPKAAKRFRPAGRTLASEASAVPVDLTKLNSAFDQFVNSKSAELAAEGT